jgi:hypothetical protein
LKNCPIYSSFPSRVVGKIHPKRLSTGEKPLERSRGPRNMAGTPISRQLYLESAGCFDPPKERRL